MNTPSACTLALALTLGLAPAVPLSAQATLEQIFPEGTLACVLMEDTAALMDGWNASPSGRMFQDPAFELMRTRMAGLVDRLGDEVEAELGVNPLALAGMIRGQLGLALLDIDGVPRDDPGLALALVAQVGEDLDVFRDGLDVLVDALVQSQGLVLKTDAVGAVDVTTLVAPDTERSELRYGMVGDKLLAVLATGPLQGGDELEGLIDAVSGEGLTALADNAAFRDSAAGDRDGQLRVWMGLGDIMLWLMDAMTEAQAEKGPAGEDKLRLMSTLGVDGLELLAMSTHVGAAGSSARTEFVWSGDGFIQQVLAALQGGDKPEALRWIPADVLQAAAADVDLAGLFDTAVGLVAQEDPDAARDFIQGMAEAEGELGFHLRDDLVDNLNGQVGFFLNEVDPSEALPGAGFPLGFVFLLGLHDGDAMRALVDAAVRQQGMHAARRREEFEGFEIYVVPMLGINLTYAVLDDVFVFSLMPSLVQDVLRRRANPQLPTVASDPQVQAALKDMPSPYMTATYQPGHYQWTSLFNTLRGMQELVDDLEMLPSDDEDDIWVELVQLMQELELPADALVDKYLQQPAVSVVQLEDGRLYSETSSP